MVGLAVRRTAGPSGHANSPHPSSREGHHCTAGCDFAPLIGRTAIIFEELQREDLLALRKFVKRFMDKQPPKPRVRDEYQAMELAAADLDRLERYETRAWSRQMRAMRTFCRTQPNG